MMLRRFWSRIRENRNATDLAWAVGLTGVFALLFEYRDHLGSKNNHTKLHILQDQHHQHEITTPVSLNVSKTDAFTQPESIVQQVAVVSDPKERQEQPAKSELEEQHKKHPRMEPTQEEVKEATWVITSEAEPITKPKQSKSPYISYVPELAFSKQLFSNDLLVYQTTGIKQLDQRLIEILQIYGEKFHRQNLKIFVVDRPNVMLEAPPHFLLLRKYNTKPLPLDLMKLEEGSESIQHYYSKVIKEIQKRWVNTRVVKDTESLSKLARDKDMLVVLKAQEDDPGFLKKRVELEQMRRELNGEKDILIVNHDLDGVPLPSGEISILVPSDHENLRSPEELPEVMLGGRSHRIITANQRNQIANNFIFWPMDLPKTDYHLQLLVNMNKLTKLHFEELTRMVRDADLKIPVLLIKTNDVKTYELTLVKKEPEWLIDQKVQGVSSQQRAVEARKPRLWLLPIYQLKQFSEWFERVQFNLEPPYYKSQKEPEIERFSSKLIGSTFSQMLKDGTDSVIFFYSKTCGSCKRFGGHYEQVAKQKSSADLHFYNINTGKNKIKEGFNYGYTPIFMVMRKEQKMRPLIYKSKYLNKSMLENFIDLSREVQMMSDQQFEKAVQFQKYPLDELKLQIL